MRHVRGLLTMILCVVVYSLAITTVAVIVQLRNHPPHVDPPALFTAVVPVPGIPPDGAATPRPRLVRHGYRFYAHDTTSVKLDANTLRLSSSSSSFTFSGTTVTGVAAWLTTTHSYPLTFVGSRAQLSAWYERVCYSPSYGTETTCVCMEDLLDFIAANGAKP